MQSEEVKNMIDAVSFSLDNIDHAIRLTERDSKANGFLDLVYNKMSGLLSELRQLNDVPIRHEVMVDYEEWEKLNRGRTHLVISADDNYTKGDSITIWAEGISGAKRKFIISYIDREEDRLLPGNMILGLEKEQA